MTPNLFRIIPTAEYKAQRTLRCVNATQRCVNAIQRCVNAISKIPEVRKRRLRAFTLHYSPASRGVWYRTSTDAQPWISRDLTFIWITFAPVIVCISYVYRLSSRFVYHPSYCLVSTLPSVTRVLFAAAAFFLSSLSSQQCYEPAPLRGL